MTWRERLGLTKTDRQILEDRIAALEGRTGKLEERWSRLLWQVQAVVKSIIRQYMDKRDE